jgi:hypothetical protein
MPPDEDGATAPPEFMLQNGQWRSLLSQSTERSITHNIITVDLEDASLIASLREQFCDQFGENADPRAIFDIIKNLKKVGEDDFWLSFCLAYPRTVSSVKTLRDSLQNLMERLNNLNSRHTYGIHKIILHQCSATQYHWRGNLDSLTRPNPDYPSQFRYFWWKDNDVLISEAVSAIANSWADFSHELQNIEEPIPRFAGMSERLNELVEYLKEKAAVIQNYQTIIEEYEGQSLISALAVKLLHSDDPIAAEEKKLEALLQPPGAVHLQGRLIKTGSWNSSSKVPQDSAGIKTEVHKEVTQTGMLSNRQKSITIRHFIVVSRADLEDSGDESSLERKSHRLPS